VEPELTEAVLAINEDQPRTADGRYVDEDPHTTDGRDAVGVV
jgi:hypothetical protein